MPATSDLSSRPVLGIETSCDETACAVYDGERGLLAHALYSQVRLHAEYGGVVPELASRDHVARIHGLVRGVLDEAGIVPSDLGAIAHRSEARRVGKACVSTG